MNFGNKIIIPIAISTSFISTLSSASVDDAQKALIDTIIKKQNSIQAIKAKKIDGKNVVINTNGSRVMIRLKEGIKPKKAFNEFLQQNKIKNNEVEFVKSFPLIDSKISINKGKTKKHLLILKSKSMSAKELLDLSKKFPGAELAEESKVVSINSQNFPNDPEMPQLWGMHNENDADIDAPEAWEKHQGSANVVVGVIDTGVDYDHQDLHNNMWVNYAELNGDDGVDDDENGYVDDIYGIDTYNGDSDPMDDAGHGTHVSGTIAAEGNNSIGVVGVNWRAKVAACKFIGSDGYGYIDGAIECMNYFNALKSSGVNIVATNNSWGGGGYSEIFEDTLQEANALNINFVAAAGNSNLDNDTNDVYPANYDVPNVISVAATNNADELAWFSDYGATTVDLAAPGVDIVSTLPTTYTCQQNGNSIYFEEDFESGDNNWSMLTVDPYQPFQDFTNEHWEINNTTAYSGVNSLDDSLGRDYNNSRLQTAMMKGTIDLSSVPTDETVCASFQVKGKIEKHYDSLFVIASPDGGTNWYLLGNPIDGEFEDWTERGVIIPSELRTSNLKLALVRYSDCCYSYEGYTIDDVKIGSADVIAIPNYGSYSGTSMATPHVTGAIAFFASINDNKTAVERKTRILNSVDVLPQLDGIVATSGRLNINNALNTPEYYANLEKIIGEWTVNYNWTMGTASLIFNDDFTFNADGYNGIWTYNGSAIEFIFTNGTTYSTTSLDLTAGTMSGTMFNGPDNDTIADGTWSAVKVDNDNTDSKKFKADINGDGYDDIIVKNTANGRVNAWLGSSSGSVTNKYLKTLPTDVEIVNIADINGDNYDDIIVKNTANGRVNAWLGSSSGSVTSKYLKTLPTDVEIVNIADINGDGYDDIIVKNTANGRVNAWLGSSSGSVTNKYLKTLPTDVEIVNIADINGDNYDDIIVKNTANGRVNAWLGSSSGSVTSKYLKTLPTDVEIVNIADINGDNYDDIIVKNTANGRVNAWLGSSSSSVTNQYLKTLPTGVDIVNFADINGDDFDDIIVKNTANGRVNAWLGSASSVTNQYLKTLPTDVEIVGISNINGDDFDDIIVKNTANGRVNAWLGSASGVTNQYLKTLSTDVEIVVP